MDLGGADHPSEVLLTFLFRYGSICSKSNVGTRCKRKDVGDDLSHYVTPLSREIVICSGGGSADLQPVFNIDECVNLFKICWERLVNAAKGIEKGSSFIGTIIDSTKLRREREKSLLLSRGCPNVVNQQTLVHMTRCVSFTKGSASIVSNNIVKQNNTSNTGARKTLLKKEKNQLTSTTTTCMPATSVNATSDEVVRSYSCNNNNVVVPPKRGPRGGLTPKYRPDIDAKKISPTSSTQQRDAYLFGRTSKCRKNKKKQKRDEALTEFASYFQRQQLQKLN